MSPTISFVLSSMGLENSTALSHLQKHRYYLPGGDVYFLSGNQMFRVHSYFLQRESNVLEKRFQSPSIPGGPRNGESESTAFVLDVPAAAFEKLLNVFYNPKYSVYDWPVEDWTTIIELAQMWGFPEVLELAIRELKKLNIPLIKRIALYQRFKIDTSHLIPLYGMLCRRSEALNMEECSTIGLETTVLITNARECLMKARLSKGDKTPLPAEFEDSEVQVVLASLLATSG